MMKLRFRIGLSLLLATGALWPAAREALANDEVAESPARVVLRKLPNDPTVLINVAGYEMPGSPDILNLGKRATAALERCLSDNTDTGLRVVCARVLNDLGDPRALPTLRTALDDWEEPVRYEVARALVELCNVHGMYGARGRLFPGGGFLRGLCALAGPPPPLPPKSPLPP